MLNHLEYPRSIPARMPPGHVPAAPRYSARWPELPRGIVSDYYSLQGEDLPWSAQDAFFARARDAFAAADGPDSFEIMRCVDEAGLTNAIVVAYWLDPVAHQRWAAASPFIAWFRHDDWLAGPHGVWRETVAVPYDRHETIFSEPAYKAGIARTEGAALSPITTNGYFGAARDRLPVSAIDPLDSPFGDRAPASRSRAGFGQRLRVTAPMNMVALRSGQYWAHAEAEQLDDYVANMHPKLMRGMQHLMQHKQATGTLSLRIMTNLDDDGSERRETSVYAHFLSLAPLEAWSASHATHLDIYQHAIKMNRHYKEARQFVSWHEVFVLLSGAFEYANCHPGTGLLPYFDAIDIRG